MNRATKQTKQTVLLGMSGGTDSSVTAIMLQEQGYDVIGITFRFYERESDTSYLEEARSLAQQLGIRHITYDVRKPFREKIISYFIDSYMQGETPVPCTLCNNYFKWPLMLEIADKEGIDFIATGHYIRKIFLQGHYYIAPGVDPDKDQSFFMWGLDQEILKRMLLPLGNLTKQYVRQWANERGYQHQTQKKESIGVCFCPKDYRSFLRREVAPDAFIPGHFIDEDGSVLGTHNGYPFFTIGQRRGLGINLNKPTFVKKIDTKTHDITLAPLSSLAYTSFPLRQWHAIDTEELLALDEVEVRIRYRKQFNTGRVQLDQQGRLIVLLNQQLTAVASGQAAVFYFEGRVLGGGIIDLRN